MSGNTYPPIPPPRRPTEIWHWLSAPRWVWLLLLGPTATVGIYYLPKPVSVLLMIAYGASLCLGLMHRRELCVRCLSVDDLTRVSAARARARFQTYHRCAASGGGIARTFLLYGSLGAGAGFVVPGESLMWGCAGALVGMARVLFLQDFHSRNLIWCPWCEEGGSGDFVVDPDPERPSVLPRR